MNEFLLLFRMDITSTQQPSPEQMQASMKYWQDWLGGIAAQNKLVTAGNRLARDGKFMKTESLVTNGPYVETKESIGGYSIIKADSYDEAVELSKGCPIFSVGGSVEVRQIMGM